MVRSQSLDYHARSEVGSANADINHIADRLTGIPAPVTGMHPGDEFPHLLQYRVHSGHDILSVDPHGAIGTIAQSHMQCRTLFRAVNRLARKHPLDFIFEPAFARKVAQ